MRNLLHAQVITDIVNDLKDLHLKEAPRLAEIALQIREDYAQQQARVEIYNRIEIRDIVQTADDTFNLLYWLDRDWPCCMITPRTAFPPGQQKPTHWQALNLITDQLLKK